MSKKKNVTAFKLAHVIEETQHLVTVSLSGKWHQNPCSGPAKLFQGLNTRHDWPFQKHHCSKNSQQLDQEASRKFPLGQ